MSDEPEAPISVREEALLGLKKRRDFQGHLVAFILVNVAVWAIWVSTGDGVGDLWPAWITGIWGVGLILNWWDAYFRRPITEADVQRETERLNPQQ